MRKHDFKTETDPAVAKKVWRTKALSCSYCPPNRKENASRRARHGARPPKGKRPKRGQ